ncbi:MAG: thymidylate synthase [Candidatus Gracilibacteria bacterium]|jgi:thymidylate synthase
MKQYLELVCEILDKGEEKGDRTGTGTISMFGAQKRYDLREGFPMVTTKKVIFKSVIYELLWFLKGITNVNDGLRPYTKIWDPWANAEGDIGPLYGYQWINWEKFTYDEASKNYKMSHVNQIQGVLDLIKKDPNSRRIIVSAWNVGDLDKMALAPCHAFFQFNVANGFIDLQLYQRSADTALGVPFNIASYSALLMMVAQECNLTPRYFVHTLGDAHIYKNHVEGLKLQLTRTPHKLPTLKIAKKPFWQLKFEDFELVDYEHDEFIKFPIAV